MPDYLLIGGRRDGDVVKLPNTITSAMIPDGQGWALYERPCPANVLFVEGMSESKIKSGFGKYVGWATERKLLGDA
jgi:hypothetical protein